MFINASNFRPSVPVRKHPLLSSEGYPPGSPVMWTTHDFVETRKVPDPAFGELRPQWVHIFKCTETGAERVFGCDGPNYTEEP